MESSTMISIGLVFTIIGSLIGYATFYMNSKKNTKQETKEEVATSTRLDTKLDMMAAKNASINSIGVLCGYGDEEELLKYTNIVKKDALEAIKYISTL